jgi:hypothetical protein
MEKHMRKAQDDRTPTDKGEALFWSAVEIARKISDDLEKKVGKVFLHDTAAYQFEVIAFAMFPFDLAFHVHASKNPARDLNEIRDAFNVAIFEDMRKQGASDEVIESLEGTMADRFDEYSAALREKKEGFEGYGLMKLGEVAYKNILNCRDGDVFGVMTLSLHFGLTIKFAEEFIQSIS